MKLDHDELMIKRALISTHTPDYNIHQQVQEKLHKRKKYTPFKKIIPIAIASVMFLFTFGVSAAYIPSFNNLVAIVSPKIAEQLQPIQMSSEDNGIKMEVVAAMADEEMAVIYITMQDLTGDRIDKTLDLYDDYSLTGGYNTFNCQVVDYDEKTKKATLQIQANGKKGLSGDKLNFRLNSFLSHKQTFEKVDLNVNLLDIKKKLPQTMLLDRAYYSGGGGELYEEFWGEKLDRNGKVGILKPGGAEMMIPEIDFVHISNIGFIGNRLHVQTKWEENNVDNHGLLYIVDSFGKKIDSASISFGMDDSGKLKYGSNMSEEIFDIGDADVSNLKLIGDFVTSKNHTKGNWSTTFKIEPMKEQQNKDVSIDFGTWASSRMVVSPLGVTLYGEGEASNPVDTSVSVKMKDGTTQVLDSRISFSDEEEVKFKFLPTLSLDIANIEAVIINGMEIIL
ncbi:MAG: DUF4179 domain-containing protein [Bacillaceae bacterium]